MWSRMLGLQERELSSYQGTSRRHLHNNCHGYSYHPAVHTDQDVDIFKDDDKTAKEVSKILSIPIYEAAKQVIASGPQPNATAEMATIDPTYSNCAWLRIKHIERAGLAHTFDAWSYYLRMAIHHNLTYYSPFYTADHGICNLNETCNFFGFHNAYYWARSPPENATVVHVAADNNRCDETALSSAISNHLKTNNITSFSCTRGDVVFICYNVGVPFINRIAGTLKGVERPSRSVFKAAYSRNKGPYVMQPLLLSKQMNETIISVHMRRGDVVVGRVETRRLVSFGVYSRILKNILEVRGNSSSSPLRPLKVYFLCEGAKSSDTVVEYHQHELRKTYELNTSAIMSPFCNETNNCKFEVLWAASFLQSFATMCESDVIVTGTSGFSYLAAALCEPKMTVAIPLISSFESVRNVVHINHKDPLWKSDAEFTLINLEKAWADVL